MSDVIANLVNKANGLVNAGRWEEGAAVWQQLQALQPGHPQALFGLGFHAYQQGDLARARQWLEACIAVAPLDLLAQLTLASVAREQGDSTREQQCLDGALTIDPYHLPALLLKADWHDRQGQTLQAATTYRNALKIAPAASHWPESLRPQLQKAAALVQHHTTRLAEHLQARLAELHAVLPATERSRWQEAMEIQAGRRKAYVAQSNQLHIPRLPAIPFFERAQFPWLLELESHTALIRDELLALLAAEQADFTPYISYAPGEPVNQWQDLNHSRRWSAFHLWRGGTEVVENTARCPETAAILRRMQLAEIDGLCPNVLFSALAPHTHIPPHHGETNARLVAHLPLVVPERCRLRVGYEERTWTIGETLIFDDCIEHEASNDSDDLRVVLIFDLWNPLLSDQERQLVQAMTAAMREFHL